MGMQCHSGLLLTRCQWSWWLVEPAEPAEPLEQTCGERQIKFSRKCLKNEEVIEEAASQKEGVAARAARKL